MQFTLDRRCYQLSLKLLLLGSSVVATVTFMLYSPVQPTWQTVTVDSLTEPESMFGAVPSHKLRKSLQSQEHSIMLNFERTTVPINPHPYKFILLEAEICTKTRPDMFILAVVHTAPKNYKRRMLIRETWGSQRLYKEVKTVVIFAMGLTNDEQTQNAVRMESERYHDIVQEDFFDSYKNLTLKGIMWLKWASFYCPNAVYVLKVDDDIFVNIFNLVGHLHHLYRRQIAKDASILCLLWTKMPVMRDEKSKWYISKADYDSDYFSTYCSGSAYIVSGDLIYPMFQASFHTRFFWVDDFYITGLLPKDLNVTYHNMGSLYVLKGADMQEKLVDSYSIFGHVQSLTHRYKLWKEILKLRGIKDW